MLIQILVLPIDLFEEHVCCDVSLFCVNNKKTVEKNPVILTTKAMFRHV